MRITGELKKEDYIKFATTICKMTKEEAEKVWNEQQITKGHVSTFDEFDQLNK